MKLKVEKIVQNTNNPKIFSIASGGEWYSLWTKGGVCPLAEGQEYEVTIKEKESNGKVFKNIYLNKDTDTEVDATEDNKKHHVVEPGEERTMTKEELEKKVGPSPYDVKTNRIEKMACLKAACFFSTDAKTCIENAQVLLRSLDEKWLND